jgi:magnesium transporter
MPANVVRRILALADNEMRAQINEILHYPKNSAGSIMTTEFVDLKKDMTVAAAFERIRRVGIDKETIYTCYVIDDNRHLLGLVTAKTLLLSSTRSLIGDIMETNIISVSTMQDKEEVGDDFVKYGFLAMPVVDNEHRLVGIITMDDAMSVIKEESEDDFAKMAAITSSAETPYLRTSVFEIWKTRIPWLIILMISATVSSTILASFESALPAVLVLFVPMLMGTSGNSGGQSSVTVIRSLSHMEIEFSDLWRVFWKEFRVGVLCGLTLGVATFVKVELVERLLLGNSDVTLIVALTVSLSLTVTIILAKVVGAILPILAKRIKLDPAVMASPLITTVVDALSLVVYFYIAQSILGL